MSEYRHEYKYICSQQQLICIKNRIEPYMGLDINAGENGSYTIRSLYFDDYKNTCYYDNLSGVDLREKFRIRIYNADSSYIRLELKQKRHGMTRKLSCPINAGLCRKLARGEIVAMNEMDEPLYRKLFIEQSTRLLKPKIIVEYDRVPYVYRDGNVRVTFDTNIRSSVDIESFFEKRITKRPVMETGYHVLEIKFDEWIPDFIHHAIQMDKLHQTAYSKYCLCRKYNLRGVI
ncbi:MAG: polyphosphate polymerase domain-containing protein [Lachnospiraceae bacterium]|nr:polyphosphate polymerase domain-containing protein [Lachnospiraceae bacterium]